MYVCSMYIRVRVYTAYACVHDVFEVFVCVFFFAVPGYLYLTERKTRHFVLSRVVMT